LISYANVITQFGLHISLQLHSFRHAFHRLPEIHMGKIKYNQFEAAFQALTAVTVPTQVNLPSLIRHFPSPESVLRHNLWRKAGWQDSVE
jgi:hypothetical protein